MNTESLPSKNEIELSYRISTIIACDIAASYAGGLATIYHEQGMNYERNKTIQVSNACAKAIDVVSRDLETILPHTKDHVERLMTLVYEIVGMSVEKQEEVKLFIEGMK